VELGTIHEITRNDTKKDFRFGSSDFVDRFLAGRALVDPEETQAPTRSWASSPHIVRKQVVVRVPAADQGRCSFFINQHSRRQWPAIVVEHLCQGVSAAVE
jgi:hypothetical protein